MSKHFLIMVMAMASSLAHAKRYPATYAGLSPETGYLNMVTPDEPCDQKTDVLLQDLPQYALPLLTKCDGKPIGWVTMTFKGSQFSNTAGDQFDLQVHNDYRYPSNFEILEAMAIETCGSSRDDEFNDPAIGKIRPSRDAKGNYQLLQAAKEQNLKVRMQLFFNEYFMSGKCIGKIMVSK